MILIGLSRASMARRRILRMRGARPKMRMRRGKRQQPVCFTHSREGDRTFLLWMTKQTSILHIIGPVVNLPFQLLPYQQDLERRPNSTTSSVQQLPSSIPFRCFSTSFPRFSRYRCKFRKTLPDTCSTQITSYISRGHIYLFPPNPAGTKGREPSLAFMPCSVAVAADW